MSSLANLLTSWDNCGVNDEILRLCRSKIELGVHGDLPGWLDALDDLPAQCPSFVSLDDVVTVGADDLSAPQRAQLEGVLSRLHPWRKGPFCLFGIYVDAEWRCDQKWQRIAPHVALRDRTILDVGCGNGYYGWRMLNAGAMRVTGIDPGLVFLMQHATTAYYLDDARNTVLPLKLSEFDPRQRFDVVFSLGVIYHRRDPRAHLKRLNELTTETVVVESLVVDDAHGPVLEPKARYARMRNVWAVPTAATLCVWLEMAGFVRPQVLDVTATTASEQRTTNWMRFESLDKALDQQDPTLTVEGYPAPKRAVIIARRER